MKKTGKRIWYGIAIFLSGLILLLSVLGIAGVWITERALAKTVVQVLDSVGNITETLRQTTQGVDQKLERLQSVSSLISTVSGKLSQNVNDQGLLLLLLPEEEEQNLVSLTSSVNESVSTLRDVLTAGLSIYRTIDQLPFISMPAPSQEQVDKIQSSVGEIQSSVENVRTEVAAFRSGISGRITNVQTGADSLTSRVGQSRDRLADLDARLAIIQESLVQWQKTAQNVLVLLSFLVTLLLVWVIYSQVELLLLYRHRWKAAGVKVEIETPPDQAASIQTETITEPGSEGQNTQEIDQPTN
jgi:hypothetical protein